ncbi:MAG: hypothetical protein K8R77_06375 [Anaerolineaceae bacterium]|nr:hypothetical protein [Anaerolineaceae bacterium]
MMEPTVPVLSQAILERKPKPSGICPPWALVLMFGAGLPISAAVGVTAHYAGILVGRFGVFLTAAVTRLILGLCCFVAYGVGFSAFSVIVVVVVVYPFVVGVFNGLFIGQLGKSGKCRNASTARWAGAFNGIIAYAAHAVIVLVMYANLHALTINVSTIEDIFGVTLDGTPWWMYVLIGVEAIIVVVSSALVASDEIKELTFCEEHGVWYGDWREGRYPVKLAEAIAETLESGALQGFEDITRLTEQEYPHLLIRMRKCPVSPGCDVEIAGKVFWLEKKVDKKGKKSVEECTKEWFYTMVTPSLGEAFGKA